MTLSAKWISLFAIIWLIGTWLGNTYDGYSSFDTSVSIAGVTGNNSATLGALASGSEVSQKLPLVGNISFISAGIDWVSSAFEIVFWQWSFVEPYPMLQNIFTAFALMGLLTLIMIVYGMITGNLTWG